MPAAPLPPGKVQFFSVNGDPLVDGTVGHYYPGGLVAKDTWQDYDQSILNDNPLILDARGEAIIWGAGRYRQILKDADGNTIWDRETFVAEPVRPADPILTYTGGPPGPSEFLGGEAFVRDVTFPADLVGSFGLPPGTNPAASFAVTIKLSGVAVGTATCSTAGVWSFETVGHVGFNAEAGVDYLQFFGPASADAAIADFGFTMKGTLDL